MDIDVVLYIVVIIGSILWTIVKNANKDEKERQAKKNVGRPVAAGPVNPAPVSQPREKPQNIFSQEQNSEPFTYETMSERDFEQAFAQHAESTFEASNQKLDSPAASFSMSEEDVFKGVVWSEILKRKY